MSWKRTGSPPLSGWCASARRRYADRRTRSDASHATPRISCGSNVAEALAHSTAVGWIFQHTAPAPSTCGGRHAPARAASADAGRDGPGKQIRFFALHRARDDYGRQARDEGDQHEEQVKCGRAVVFFYMNHGFALFKEINLRGVEDVTYVSFRRRIVGPRLSLGSLSPASRGALYARATSWRLASGLFSACGARAHANSASDFELLQASYS